MIGALSQLPPGPELGARLAAINPRDVPDEQLLTLVAAQYRQSSYQQAQLWAVMAELAARPPMNLPDPAAWTPEQVFDSAVDEVRAELRLTRRAARRELERADAVIGVPRVARALRDGRIDRGKAVVLADGCWDLTDDQRDRLLDAVLPDAVAVTATGLAEHVQRVAIALDPAWAERRYREAVRDRKVVSYLNPDGSATVSGQNLPADEAALAVARVTELARSAKRSGADATLDRLRSELFLGLLGQRFQGLAENEIVNELLVQFPKREATDVPGATDRPAEPDGAADRPAAADPPAADQPTEHRLIPTASAGVELRVGLTTLLGLDDEPGTIAGWGAITADVARALAERQRRSEWRFAVVDEAGRLLFDGITRQRPTSEAAASSVAGGIVELHVPERLLEAGVIEQYGAWVRVLQDVARQYDAQSPIEQDPSARFAGRPLRRRSQVRHRTCLFPGCRRPAIECDLDHRDEYARGGPTVEGNLGPGCRHDHQLKTVGGWRLVKRGADAYAWISPLGRRHVVRIDPVAPPLPPPRPREPVSDPPPP